MARRSAAVPAAVVGASRPHRRGQDALATAGKMLALHGCHQSEVFSESRSSVGIKFPVDSVREEQARDEVTQRKVGLVFETQRWEGADDCHRFEADGDDLSDEAEDVLGVVGAVGIVGDAAAFVG